jgi:hypothetical protein
VAPDGYRLTEVRPDGRVRAGAGTPTDATREDLASPTRRPDRGGTRGAPGPLDEIDAGGGGRAQPGGASRAAAEGADGAEPDLDQSAGAKAVQQRVDAPVPVVRFRVERELGAGDPSTAEGKDHVIDALRPGLRA